KTKLTNLITAKLNNLKVEGCPKQFGAILEYISLLRYHQRPDYDQIENLFVAAIQQRNIDRKAPFEWVDPKADEYIPHVKESSKKPRVMTATKKQLTKEIATAVRGKREKPTSEVEQLEATLTECGIDTTQRT
ncbi:unnamed protein product, partial [Acanthocheilonema viteae]